MLGWARTWRSGPRGARRDAPERARIRAGGRRGVKKNQRLRGKFRPARPGAASRYPIPSLQMRTKMPAQAVRFEVLYSPVRGSAANPAVYLGLQLFGAIGRCFGRLLGTRMAHRQTSWAHILRSPFMAAVYPAATPTVPDRSHEPLACRYTRIREASLAICSPLEVEDYVVQSMPDTSPAKWHLAHTSWFFEQFLLRPLLSGYQPFQDRVRVPVQLVLPGRRPHAPAAGARLADAAHRQGSARVSPARRRAHAEAAGFAQRGRRPARAAGRRWA